jgi:hypothetical protein
MIFKKGLTCQKNKEKYSLINSSKTENFAKNKIKT